MTEGMQSTARGPSLHYPRAPSGERALTLPLHPRQNARARAAGRASRGAESRARGPCGASLSSSWAGLRSTRTARTSASASTTNGEPGCKSRIRPATR